eukprot:TRINITY_DN2355_c0_g1_i2.p1 TRINITY_DN2355_c0_g1~~TRINITY_DN2355_c0_g1_i2.p1  ORF type:complete len:263 (+),score=28.66 TRINITY_DN2355_c0_g1_i2:88-876(+)
MVLNKAISYDQVIASHIIPVSSGGKCLTGFGLTEDHLFHKRNGLLLYKPIEKAFDHKDICFLYNPFTKKLFLKVLNAFLLKSKVHGNTRWKDIDGTELHLPEGVWPFRRLLNWHARVCFKQRKLDLDKIYDYFDYSQESESYDEDLMGKIFEQRYDWWGNDEFETDQEIIFHEDSGPRRARFQYFVRPNDPNFQQNSEVGVVVIFDGVDGEWRVNFNDISLPKEMETKGSPQLEQKKSEEEKVVQEKKKKRKKKKNHTKNVK